LKKFDFGGGQVVEARAGEGFECDVISHAAGFLHHYCQVGNRELPGAARLRFEACRFDFLAI